VNTTSYIKDERFRLQHMLLWLLSATFDIPSVPWCREITSSALQYTRFVYYLYSLVEMNSVHFTSNGQARKSVLSIVIEDAGRSAAAAKMTQQIDGRCSCI